MKGAVGPRGMETELLPEISAEERSLAFQSEALGPVRKIRTRLRTSS